MTFPKALMLSAADVQPITEARPVGSIAVGRGPIADIAVDVRGGTVVTTNHGDSSVSVLDPHQMTVRGTVHVEGEPFAVSAARGRAFVAASMPTYDALSAIDTRNMSYLASRPLKQHVVDAAPSHDGRQLFVVGTGHDAAELAIVDVESGRTDTFAIPSGVATTVNAVRVTPNGRLAFVATSDIARGNLVVVDVAKRRVVAVMPTVAPIRDVVLSNARPVAYVLGVHPEHGGVVETIDTARNRVLATAWIGGAPTQFALGADATRMYIVDGDHVAVLCMITNEITDTIAVAANPSAVAMSGDGTHLYVADYSGAVSVFAVAPPTSFDDVIVDAIVVPHVRELQPASV